MGDPVTALLPVGTYVRVTKFLPVPHEFVGKIVGYDLHHSKYEIGARYGGWGEWLFLEGGTWAFPREVEQISEDDAHAVEVQT